MPSVVMFIDAGPRYYYVVRRADISEPDRELEGRHVVHRTRLAIVEDHVLQRTYTSHLIERQPDLEVVFSGETLPAFLGWLRDADRTLWPQLVLLDLMVERQPSADPDVVTKLIAAGFRVLVFSALASPPLVRRMIAAGVSGVLGKRDSEADLLAAIRAVSAGEEWMSTELAGVIAHDPRRPKLSEQEERALILYSSGFHIDDVAESIGVKKDTAKKYLQRVRAKYAQAGRPMRSRLEMSRIAFADGYIDLSGDDVHHGTRPPGVI